MSATSLARAMSGTTHNKLFSRATGPFRVLAVCSHTMTIDEDGIDNTTSTDRVTRTPNATRLTQRQQARRVSCANVNQDFKTVLPPQSARLVSQTGNQHMTTPRGKKSAKSADNHQPDGTDLEYTVDCIVRHAGSDTNTRYRVRWFGDQAESDTEKPSKNLPNIL